MDVDYAPILDAFRTVAILGVAIIHVAPSCARTLSGSLKKRALSALKSVAPHASVQKISMTDYNAHLISILWHDRLRSGGERTGSNVHAANWNQRAEGEGRRMARWAWIDVEAARCVIWTPFGLPVEPEVKRTVVH